MKDMAVDLDIFMALHPKDVDTIEFVKPVMVCPTDYRKQVAGLAIAVYTPIGHIFPVNIPAYSCDLDAWAQETTHIIDQWSCHIDVDTGEIVMDMTINGLTATATVNKRYREGWEEAVARCLCLLVMEPLPSN